MVCFGHVSLYNTSSQMFFLSICICFTGTSKLTLNSCYIQSWWTWGSPQL